LMLGAVSVGIAEGALDELVELANTGRQQLHAAVPMRDSETFQSELGRVAAELRAARAFLEVPGNNPLAARAFRNAEGRDIAHTGHADRDMARNHLRSRCRRVLRASR
jgi:alkylation response protein AidB-like acyl-CoA dehydrogenase